MRKCVSHLLVVLLALGPSLPLSSAPALGMVQGTVTLEGRALAGVDLVLVDSLSGAVYRARSSKGGSFQTQLAPGSYLITTENSKGLVVGHGPSLLPVVAGQVASASIDLLALAIPRAQETPAPELPPGQGQISMQPEATCFVANEFPLLAANVTPPDKVARVRVYFKSSLGDAYYYIEAVPGESGLWEGKLPRPKVEASPITYYWQATFTDFGESTGKEVEAIVVADANECGDRPVAPFGPAGPVQVFSAATGAAVAPAGFAAGALGAGAIAAIIAGAIGAGIVGGIVITNPSPTPSIPPPTTTTTTTTTTSTSSTTTTTTLPGPVSPFR
jgi:hypothetical protein